MEYKNSNSFSELRGLTATVINNESPFDKDSTGIIIDTSVCCARLACRETRATFDRTNNEYHTINEYSSGWIRWKDIKINFPTIESYHVIVTQNWGSSLRIVEGEVYNFTYKDKNVKLGINRNIGANGYNITDLLTGLYLETDCDINKLRCMLPKVAKKEAEYYINNPIQVKEEAGQLHKLPTNYYKPIALFNEAVLEDK